MLLLCWTRLADPSSKTRYSSQTHSCCTQMPLLPPLCCVSDPAAIGSITSALTLLSLSAADAAAAAAGCWLLMLLLLLLYQQLVLHTHQFTSKVLKKVQEKYVDATEQQVLAQLQELLQHNRCE